jgi:proline dehydrogenase
LNKKGINATLDHLGEHTNSIKKAEAATQDILAILDSIDQSGIKANVSIKLTQIGLALDEALCLQNLRTVLDLSRKRNTFIRIDMEDSQWVDKTLKLFKIVSEDCSCENVGVVIQSYLYRSERDIDDLMKAANRIRLCKGAYKEPPEVAFPKKSDVDSNYDNLVIKLIDGALAYYSPELSPDGKIPPMPAIATHDENRIVFAKAYAEKTGISKKALEFQMLHGIRRDLQESLTMEGFPVRVYVPYGSEWYPYFTRRLAERPANVWFFISNFFRS